MAEAGTLHDAFIDELRDTYDAEKQLTKALAKLAKAASSPPLRDAFESHLAETQGQIERLEQVFESLDEKVRGKHCDGIAGIIEEGKGAIEDIAESAVRDSALAAGGRRAEHYEIAAYSALIAMAEAMGRTDISRKLEKILSQEEAADRKLTALGSAALMVAQEEMAVEA